MYEQEADEYVLQSVNTSPARENLDLENLDARLRTMEETAIHTEDRLHSKYATICHFHFSFFSQPINLSRSFVILSICLFILESSDYVQRRIYGKNR